MAQSQSTGLLIDGLLHAVQAVLHVHLSQDFKVVSYEASPAWTKYVIKWANAMHYAAIHWNKRFQKLGKVKA